MKTSQAGTSGRGIQTTLSAEVFKEIIAALRSDDNSSRGADKRGSPRVGLRAKLAIVIGPPGPSDEPPLDVWVRDLSAGGIGIVHNREIERGTPFVTQLPRRQGPPLRVLYEVAHCKHLAKEIFSIGGKLIRILP